MSHHFTGWEHWKISSDSGFSYGARPYMGRQAGMKDPERPDPAIELWLFDFSLLLLILLQIIIMHMLRFRIPQLFYDSIGTI